MSTNRVPPKPRERTVGDEKDDLFPKTPLKKAPTIPNSEPKSSKDSSGEALKKDRLRTNTKTTGVRGKRKILRPPTVPVIISKDLTLGLAHAEFMKRVDLKSPDAKADEDIEQLINQSLTEWLSEQKYDLPQFFGQFDSALCGFHTPTLLHRILNDYNPSPQLRKGVYKKRHALVTYLLTSYPHLYQRKRREQNTTYQGSDDQLYSDDYDYDNQGASGSDRGEDSGAEDIDEDDRDGEPVANHSEAGDGERDSGSAGVEFEGDGAQLRFDDSVKTALQVAMEKAMAIDDQLQRKNSTDEITIDPFLQLLVKLDPQETVSQFHHWHASSSGLTMDPRDSRHLHQLLPRVWASENSSCMLDLLTHLDHELLKSTDKEQNTVLHLVARYSLDFILSAESELRLLSQIQGIFQRFPEAASKRNSSQESPYLHRLNTARQRNKEPTDKITAYLKKRCVACSPEQAFQLLHGEGPKIQHPRIFLDLVGLKDRSDITEDQLEAFLSCQWLKLDDVLRYIRIPSFRVVPGKKNANAAKSQNRSVRSERDPNNCTLVFNILRKLKPPVSTILDVSVDDMSEKFHPHSNQDIIACLKPEFSPNIEKWDWNKIDMCSDAIHEAAPNATEIYLYCSGNNAILKSWSALDGLPKFANLEKVRIKICKGYIVESKVSIDNSIAVFKLRLNENYRLINKQRTIEVQIDDKDLQNLAQPSRPGQASATAHVQVKEEIQILKTNSWLEKMRKFAQFIYNTPNPEGDEPKRIKVAVLDDGFDLIQNIHEFKDNKIVGKAFSGLKTPVDGDERFSTVEYFSELGHGTLMAKNIRQICPKVELYLAKLNNVARDHPQSGGSGKAYGPTEESAVEAINWARENKVDVISMSWTRTVPNEQCPLQDALDKASKAGILLFGAASDQGHNIEPNTLIYPAMHNKVFCIGAADMNGNLDQHVGSGADYVFPGGDSAEVQGSSFATALAAGLAALILHCAEYENYFRDESQRSALRQHTNMNKVFEAMLAPQTKYLSIGKHFNEKLYNNEWDLACAEQFSRMVNAMLAPAGI